MGFAPDKVEKALAQYDFESALDFLVSQRSFAEEEISPEVHMTEESKQQVE